MQNSREYFTVHLRLYLQYRQLQKFNEKESEETEDSADTPATPKSAAPRPGLPVTPSKSPLADIYSLPPPPTKPSTVFTAVQGNCLFLIYPKTFSNFETCSGLPSVALPGMPSLQRMVGAGLPRQKRPLDSPPSALGELTL